MCQYYNDTDYAPSYMTAHAVCSFTLAVLGTVGNSISIFLIFRGRLHKGSLAMMLLVNLCVANLLTNAFILPLVGVNTFDTGWIYGSTFCSVFGFMMYIGLTTECVILMSITVNQYFVIVRNAPQNTLIEHHRVLKLLLFLLTPWAVSAIIYIFPLTNTWDTFGYDPRRGYCTLLNVSGKINIKSTLSLASIIITTSVILYCYANIYWAHYKSRRKTTTSLTEATVKSRSNARNAQLVRMITIILVNFFLTYIPFLVMTAADSCLSYTPQAVFTTIIYVSWSHTATNPVIYALVNRQIQAQWRRILPCCHRKTLEINTKTDKNVPRDKMLVLGDEPTTTKA